MKSILALILFALDLWAIIATLGSNESTGKKVLWTLGILIFPLLGFIVWFCAGPRPAPRA